MSMQNLNPMQSDPRAKPLATAMQTDEGARMQMAQFFGDPTSREFIQDSGDIKTAMSRPDNPWGIPPTPGMVEEAGVQHPAPQPTPQAAPQAPAAPTYNTPQDYAAANPGSVNVPARPVGPMDNIHGARKALMLAFLGLNKFGAGLDHQSDSYADQFLGNQMKTEQEQHVYDKSLPQVTRQAQEDAFTRYQGHQQSAATTAHTTAETNMMNGGMNPIKMQLDERRRAFMDKAVDTWTKDPRFLGNPDSFKRAIASESQGLGLDPAAIEEVMKQPQVGTKWTVDYSKDGGVPQGLRDNLGKVYTPNDINGLDPQAQGAWKAANDSYAQGQKDKINVAQVTGISRANAMNSGRPQKITSTKTGLTRVVTAAEAEELTKPGSEWVGESASDVTKQKGRWASFGDVMDATNRLHDSIKALGPQDLLGIGRMASALKEHQGVLDNATAATFQQGLSQPGAQAAADMLAVRDNIQNLISAQGLSLSDTRVQSLWNAMPGASDFSNPALLDRKLQNVYRMMKNLEPGLPGNSETFGVPNHEAAAGGTKTDLTKVSVGTLSASGKFKWDGSKWQPVTSGAGASSAQRPQYRSK